MNATWEIRSRPVDHPEAAELLRAFFEEMVRTYHKRPPTRADVDEAMAESPTDPLTPPGGVFLVARCDRRPAGCVGLRLLRPAVGKLTRMFVHAGFRGRGVGSRLITAAERSARELAVHTIQLDTRNDLVDARKLYARNGFAEVGPLWVDRYAEHWFEKRVDQPAS